MSLAVRLLGDIYVDIDEETGEVLSDIPYDGESFAALLVARAREAREQRDIWNRIDAALRRAVLARQPKGKVAYGESVANAVYPKDREEFVVPVFLKLVRECEPEHEDLLALLYAITGIDRKRVPEVFEKVAAQSTYTKPSTAYLLINPVALDARANMKEATDADA